MIAANYDIIMDRAAFYRMVLTIRDEDGAVTNLSSLSTVFYADVRDKQTKKEITQFVISRVTDGSDGKIYIDMPEASTKLLTSSRNYEYDLFMILSNKTYRLLEGDVIVR
jgi:hypothetical protein